MPAYNVEEFVGKSIESVIRQTYLAWELIVIDDGSTDSTASVVKEFLKFDKRIKYFFQQNAKQGSARNAGIKLAMGELIAFLDADDFWACNKLSRQIEVIHSNHNFSMVSSGYLFTGEADAQLKNVNLEEGVLQGVEGLKRLFQNNPICTSSVLIKRDVVVQLGGFKTSETLQFGEDYDLWLRILIGGFSICLDKKNLVYYRLHSNQSTKKTAGTKHLQILKCLSSLPNNELYNIEKNIALRVWFRRLLKSELTSRNVSYEASKLYPNPYIKFIIYLILFTLPFDIARNIIYRLVSFNGNRG